MKAPFATFSSLMQTIHALDGDITDATATKHLLNFYHYWGNYLDPTSYFLALLLKPIGGLAKVFYYLTNSLEHVFNNSFKLLGLFGYLGDTKTVIGQAYHGLQLVGVALFTLVLVVRVLSGLFNKPLKYKDALLHFLFVSIVVAVLPFGVTEVSKTLAEDAQAIETMGESSYSSLAIQPMANNVVDVNQLIKNDFNATLFPQDNAGFIQPAKKEGTPVNTITDSEESRLSSDYIGNLDFSATLGVTNTKYLDTLDKKNTGIKGLFLHYADPVGETIGTIAEHRVAGTLNALEPIYLRYKVNWIGMFAQYIVLIILLLLLTMKAVKSIFETLLTCVIAPIQGYSSAESSKKFKELLLTIFAALAGIYFEVIIMRIALEVMRDLPAISLAGVENLSGAFFDGLNMWERCLSSVVVYFGVFFASMQGVGQVEKWLGVSTGHSDTAQQVMGGALAATATLDAGEAGATLTRGALLHVPGAKQIGAAAGGLTTKAKGSLSIGRAKEAIEESGGDLPGAYRHGAAPGKGGVSTNEEPSSPNGMRSEGEKDPMSEEQTDKPEKMNENTEGKPTTHDSKEPTANEGGGKPDQNGDNKAAQNRKPEGNGLKESPGDENSRGTDGTESINPTNDAGQKGLLETDKPEAHEGLSKKDPHEEKEPGSHQNRLANEGNETNEPSGLTEDAASSERKAPITDTKSISTTTGEGGLEKQKGATDQGKVTNHGIGKTPQPAKRKAAPYTPASQYWKNSNQKMKQAVQQIGQDSHIKGSEMEDE